MKKIKIDKEKCKSCAYCVIFCNKKLINLAKEVNTKGFFYAEFDDKEGKCVGCALCAVMCPDVAIEVIEE